MRTEPLVPAAALPRAARWQGRGWSLLALGTVALPLALEAGFAHSLLAQATILAVFALSYNLLLGTTGLLSFGHAVYFGLGGYAAIHLLRAAGSDLPMLPTPLLPLAGAAAGALAGLTLGWLATRRGGTPFAMISLALGELVFASALIFQGFFGGEAGLSGNRATGGDFLGIGGLDFASERQAGVLIAVWAVLAAVAMHALTRTPLARLANAVRDNPERARFVGCDVTGVRWRMQIAAGSFAGLAGALAAIHFEAVGADSLGTGRSAGVLLATFLGGTAYFAGPIVGAVVFVLFSGALSEVTRAWQLYLGLLFVTLVLVAPGGLADLAQRTARDLATARPARVRWRQASIAAAAGLLLLGTVVLVELTYRRAPGLAAVPGGGLNDAGAAVWIVALVLVATGAGWLAWLRESAGWRWRRANGTR